MSKLNDYNGKPCPFCGGTAEVRVIDLSGNIVYREYAIECRKCHATTEWNGVLNDVIAIWEARA